MAQKVIDVYVRVDSQAFDGFLTPADDTLHKVLAKVDDLGFIDVSAGAADVGKAIKLNSSGKVDPSFIESQLLHYVGAHNPSTGTEYPDTTGETTGAAWGIEGVDQTLGYTFTTGDLSGKTVKNGDFMVWNASSWSIMSGEVNPYLYYKLDGAIAITAPFAGGGQQLKNIADGVDPTDATSLLQVETLIANKVSRSGDTMTGDLILGDNSNHANLHSVAPVASTTSWNMDRSDASNAFRVEYDSNAESTTMTLFDIDGSTVLNSLKIREDGFLLKKTIGSENFNNAFLTKGSWRLENVDDTSHTLLTVDNLTVKGALKVFELSVKKITSGNGALLISDGVQAIVETNNNVDNTVFTVNPEGNINVPPFKLNDIILIQQFNPRDHTVVMSYESTVIDVTGTRFTTSWIAGNTLELEEIYDVVRVGSLTDTTRQGTIYLSSMDDNSPYIDTVVNYDAIGGGNSTLVSRIGNLNGITDFDFDIPPDTYGIYTAHAYLKGSIVANKGSIGGWKLADDKIYYPEPFVDGLGGIEIGMNTAASEYRVIASRDMDNFTMLYDYDTSWGVTGVVGGTTMFSLGSTNKIAGFEFDGNKLWSTGVTLDETTITVGNSTTPGTVEVVGNASKLSFVDDAGTEYGSLKYYANGGITLTAEGAQWFEIDAETTKVKSILMDNDTNTYDAEVGALTIDGIGRQFGTVMRYPPSNIPEHNSITTARLFMGYAYESTDDGGVIFHEGEFNIGRGSDGPGYGGHGSVAGGISMDEDGGMYMRHSDGPNYVAVNKAGWGKSSLLLASAFQAVDDIEPSIIEFTSYSDSAAGRPTHAQPTYASWRQIVSLDETYSAPDLNRYLFQFKRHSDAAYGNNMSMGIYEGGVTIGNSWWDDPATETCTLYVGTPYRADGTTPIDSNASGKVWAVEYLTSLNTEASITASTDTAYDLDVTDELEITKASAALHPEIIHVDESLKLAKTIALLVNTVKDLNTKIAALEQRCDTAGI